jgi:protein ImuB
MRRVACIAPPEIRLEIAGAKCANLPVRLVAEEAVRGALVRVAEAALAFGPATSFCTERDVVWVEIGGCAPLHGGERALASALRERVRSLGYACRLAIAGGPRIAAAVARFSSSRTIDGIEIVPEGQGAAALRELPTAALELGDDLNTWLSALGLRTCGALQGLPRSSLAARLGACAPDVFDLLSGEDRAPLDVWRPPDVPEERIELEWGASSIEALTFVSKTLCDRLAVRLEGRGCAAASLKLTVGLDRALCDRKVETTSTFDIVLPASIARAADLLAVVRARLERETLAAPVLVVALRATALTRVSDRPSLSLFVPEPRADKVLPRLVAELTAELGCASVGTLALVDTWIPDGRTRLVSFGASSPRVKHALTVSALEPSRLVPAVRVSRASLAHVELLERIEAVEWWRPGVGGRDAASRMARCDVVAAWLVAEKASGGEGHPPKRGGVLAWLYLREGGKDARLCGFID